MPIRLLTATYVAVALTIALPVNAQTPPAQERISVLSLSGQGTIEAKAEIATIQIGVSVAGKIAKDAIAENSRLLTAALNAAKETGVEPRDLQTAGLSLYPDIVRAEKWPHREIIGYQVNNVVTMRVRDLDKVGGLLDRLVVLGINDIRSVHFSNANTTPLVEQARAAAIKDVMDKAQKYADAANLKIVRVLTISEGAVQMPGPRQIMYRTALMATTQRPDVPVEGGELVYRATVSATFEIAPK